MGGEAEKKEHEAKEPEVKEPEITGELSLPDMIAKDKESPEAKRTEYSNAVAPVPEKQPAKSATDAVKESDLSPKNQEKARKLVELTVGKSGDKLKALTDMSGASAIMTVTKALENQMLTNEDARNSRFVQGAYTLCKMFESMFGFAFTASDYGAFTSAFYPTERIEFDEAQLDEFLAERTKLQLLDDYRKKKKELGVSVNDKDKQRLQEELKKIKDLIKEQFEPNGDDPDALCKKYLDKNKEQLTKEELAKFKDSEAADAQASAYYVQKQLNIPPGADYDPDRLHASLQHTAYEDPSRENKKYPMFDYKNDPSEFYTALDAGAALPGTVVFFRWNIGGEKTALLCGIVGIDGKLRFHDSKKLHTFVRGKSDVEKYEDSILGNKDEKDSSEDADLNALSGSLFGIDLMPTSSFAGVFYPREPEEPKPEEPKTEGAKPVEGEKVEPEKPAENPSSSQS